MEELRPRLWTWTAPHPEWTPESGRPDGWARDVRSYAYDAGDTFVLFDPLAPPPELDDRAQCKRVVVLLTVHFHQRSAAELVERLGAEVFAPAAGASHVRAGATGYHPNEELAGGVVAKGTCYPEEAVLWIPHHRALVTGDVVIDGPDGPRMQPDSWLEGVTREALRDSLRPLLELPIVLLLPTHAEPVAVYARQALEHALAA
jgi:hypothetical protein